MTANVIGELSADRSTIVLIATGQDHEVLEAAQRLTTLTPLLKKSDPPGAMLCPASWSAAIQLAHTFGPAWHAGPNLVAWLHAQVIARTAPPTELRVTPPPGLIPRGYQVAGAAMIGAVGSSLLFDEPRPQPVDTPILTPTGWTTMGELRPGDVVFDVNGQPSRVRRLKRPGVLPVYRVTFSDRTSTLATGNHSWRVYTGNDRKRGSRGRVLSTDQLREHGLQTAGGASCYFLPQQPVINGLGTGSELPLDPYAYGALLGDGSLGGVHLSIACPDDYVLTNVEMAARSLETTGKRNNPKDRCANVVFHRDGKLRAVLDELGALVPSGGKAVHCRYLLADVFTRHRVLAGLLDTDGTVIRTGAGVEFSSASPQLAADVAFLARSLGAVATESDPQPAGYRAADGSRVECQPKHRVLMRFPADGPNPFALQRKADAWATAAVSVLRQRPPRAFRSIEPAGEAEVCCIELDTDDEHARVYLTDAALIPTHNTGKTITTILGLLERAAAGHQVLPVVVVAPSAVVDPWVRELQKWAPRWRTVAWRGSPAKRRKLVGLADVYVASYGTAARDAKTMDVQEVRKGNAPLMALCAKAIVADECLPGGTLIDTPDGPRSIQSLRRGDLVIGVDHATGAPVATPVVHTFTNRTNAELTAVDDVLMTPNHPVWTSRGYVPAADVLPSDLLCEVRDDGDGDRELRVVQHAPRSGGLPQQAGPSVLQPTVLGAAAHVEPGGPSDARRSPARPDEPVQGSRSTEAGTRSGTGAGLPGTDRWEWPGADRAASAACREVGVADRSGRSDRTPGAVPLVVQGRHRIAGSEGRDRGGRREPQQPEGSSTGRTQGFSAHRAGLGGTEVHEPSGAAGDRRGDGGGSGRRRVFNIETGTGNYVAAGLLVHNCHRMKDPGSTYSVAGRNLATRGSMFVGLSGTPITHTPKDLWPALYSMCPTAYPSSERWVLRYCDSIPGEYASKVIGLNDRAEPEFRQTLLGQYRRVARADVLNELPKVHSVRQVELPQQYRDAYDAVEGEMLADLPDGGGELSPMTVLSQMTGLSAIASAAADVETTWETVEDPETGLPMEKRHQHITLKLPSWKVDELLTVMAERPGYAIAAFAPSSQLMRLAGQAAAEKGYRVGYVIGGQGAKERTRYVDAFQARDLDLLCATTGAGGVGLTLSAADSLVFLQRPWSLVESLQAEDRAEGDESKERGTEVIDIVAAGTIESRVRQILVERAGQLSKLVMDPRIVIELLGGAKVRNLRKSVAA